MKIIRARIRGLGDTIESGWFELSPRLNLFHLPEEKGRASFLQTLAAINPLFSCESTRPFADFPLVSRRHGYSKKIHPEKRTVALAIFNTTAALVDDLAAVSPHLYETDRIEVGRRLDCSRWINFVEIPSSTRWCEIAANVQQLLDLTMRVAPEKADRAISIIHSLHGSDRIKDGVDRDLAEWLQSLPSEIMERRRQQIENLDTSIHRAQDFYAARKIVEQRLPIFTVITSSPAYPAPYSPLLDAVSGKIQEPGEPPAAISGDFLAEINHHLADSQFPGPRLHLTFSGAGVALTSPPATKDRPDPDSSLTNLKAAISLAIAFSRVTCRTEPILLFDSPERHVPAALHRQLREFILTVAEFCQCCYGYASVDIFSRNRGLPRYTVADLTRPG